MFSALRAWFLPEPPEAVRRTYIAAVEAARNPFFYTSLGVPDTLDGRFDLITLHLFMLQHRLLNEGGLTPLASLPPAASGSLALHKAKTNGVHPSDEACTRFAQQLSECFIRDLDANLREMGVADTGVAKRMKTMGKAYHGRLQVYAAAMVSTEALRSALARNLYGTVAEGDVNHLARMAAYVEATSRKLAETPSATLLEGAWQWPLITP